MFPDDVLSATVLSGLVAAPVTVALLRTGPERGRATSDAVVRDHLVDHARRSHDRASEQDRQITSSKDPL